MLWKLAGYFRTDFTEFADFVRIRLLRSCQLCRTQISYPESREFSLVHLQAAVFPLLDYGFIPYYIAVPCFDLSGGLALNCPSGCGFRNGRNSNIFL